MVHIWYLGICWYALKPKYIKVLEVFYIYACPTLFRFCFGWILWGIIRGLLTLYLTLYRMIWPFNLPFRGWYIIYPNWLINTITPLIQAGYKELYLSRFIYLKFNTYNSSIYACSALFRSFVMPGITLCFSYRDFNTGININWGTIGGLLARKQSLKLWLG